jgi:RNase P subunit RPR2
MICAICNSNPGERTRVEFPKTGKEFVLPMCDECYRDFSEESLVDVTRIDEESSSS